MKISALIAEIKRRASAPFKKAPLVEIDFSGQELTIPIIIRKPNDCTLVVANPHMYEGAGGKLYIFNEDKRDGVEGELKKLRKAANKCR